MNAKRLLMLADYLDGVGKFEGRGVPSEPGKFHLESWMGSYLSMAGQIPSVDPAREKIMRLSRKLEKAPAMRRGRNYSGDVEVVPIDCRTVGCACGWAATVPEFRRLGLRLMTSGTDQGYVALVKDGEVCASGVGAIEELFGIDEDEFNHLFNARAYPMHDRAKPKAVAKRIRKFVEGAAHEH